MLIWGILCAAFMLIEIAIPALVSIWFALAALVTLVFSFFIKDMLLLSLIFSILSLIFILALKPFCKKYIKPTEKLKLGEVRIISFTEFVQDKYIYDVRYKGGVWTAISEKKYDDGENIEIKEFEGNKIII